AAYEVAVVREPTAVEAVSDVRLFEALLDSELCVFLLGDGVTGANLLAAIAYAHCVPSLRLQYDPTIPTESTEVSGVVRWKWRTRLGEVIGQQIGSFRQAFVLPLELGTDPAAAALALATPHFVGSRLGTWQRADGPSLIDHVNPNDPLVRSRSQA